MSVLSETTCLPALPWELHRESLKRLLISLTRDLDLAEDLLQETYLRACRGWGAYRGGELEAWLGTIARNVFYSHCRRRYLRTEVPLDERTTWTAPTEDEHLLLDLRAAIADLSPPLRDALIMRHYGGFSYQEIATRQRCPVGTAKWRVSTAIGRLKDRFGIREDRVMTCGWKSYQILDYLYGALPKAEAERFERHLAGCAACREEIARMTPLLHGLDVVEGGYKHVKILDLDDRGRPMEYSWSTFLNGFGETMTKSWWMVNKDYHVEYAMLQHQYVVLKMLPGSLSQYRYEASLPEPVPPGAAYEALLVLNPVDTAQWAERLEDNRWRYRLETSPNTAKEWVFLLTIRLPEGATLLTTEPAPSETQDIGRHTAVSWRALLQPGSHPQFVCEITYHHAPRPGMLVETCSHEGRVVKGVPDELFAISELPYVDGGKQALDIYRQIGDRDFPHPLELFRLGMVLFDGRYYTEALDVFTRAAAQYDGNNFEYMFMFLVWQGQILDLLGRREEAIRCYRRALDLDVHPDIQHSQYGLLIDRAWAERKLDEPFEHPPEITVAIYQLPRKGAGEQALVIYRKLDLPQFTYLEPLFKLGTTLYDGEHYEEALACFTRLKQLADGRSERFTILSLAWQGIVLDLLGHRSTAKAQYQALLDHGIKDRMPLYVDSMSIDRTWVEQRLHTPFMREMR